MHVERLSLGVHGLCQQRLLPPCGGAFNTAFLRQIPMFYIHQHNSSPTRIERSIDLNPVYFVPVLYSSFHPMSMPKTNLRMTNIQTNEIDKLYRGCIESRNYVAVGIEYPVCPNTSISSSPSASASTSARPIRYRGSVTSANASSRSSSSSLLIIVCETRITSHLSSY